MNEDLYQKRLQLKDQLDQQYRAKSRGYQIRSRAQWIEEGERSTQYFLGLEKERQASNCIRILINDEGHCIDSDKDILDEATRFYSTLYRKNVVGKYKLSTYFNSVKPERTLSDESKDKCDGLITYDECFSAINNMKKNKSPGLDGISIEFYIQFWPLLGNLLVDMFNECYKTGMLPDSLRNSVFTLIFKKGDAKKLNNYRPISLTTIDYRILAFVLASRLQRVIGDLVSHDQTAYIKNRYMGHNIRLIEDTVEYFDRKNLNGLLFAADFRKAFDSLNWDFLFQALEFFGFGASFKQWIQTLYALPVATIKNNGHLSEAFEIQRGVRQGCPVSALLFILCVEFLAIKIRQHPGIKGFAFGFTNNIKISQYADDCILFLNNKIELCTALSILHEYGTVSGLELNLSKSEGFWLGKDKVKQLNCKAFGLNWPQQIRHLGIYIGYDKRLNHSKNWTDKIVKVVKLLDKWKCRQLSLFGKIQIIKTFAISQFILPTTVLTTPDHVIKQIQSILFRFLWGSRDKIKRTQAIKSATDGGLNMIDINTLFQSLKAAWIARIINADPCKSRWCQLAYTTLNIFLECNSKLMFNFDSNANFPDLQSMIPFYKEAVFAYNKAHSTTCEFFKTNIRNQCLWGNQFITTNDGSNKKVLFLRNWIRSGVNFVGDLKFIGGKLDTAYIIHKVKFRKNIWSELFAIKNALLPYKTSLMEINNTDGINRNNIITLRKLKQFYERLKSIMLEGSSTNNNFFKKYCAIEDFNFIYYKKIVSEKDIKLKEFNFKLLHGILPCNLNLFRWKIKAHPTCDVCGEIQSIEHLIYSCSYVKQLWHSVSTLLGSVVDFRTIIGCKRRINNEYILTLVSFLIYKDWLLLSLENKSRNKYINLKYIKQELNLRLDIYSACKTMSVVDLLPIENLIASL